jgi:membrane protein
MHLAGWPGCHLTLFAPTQMTAKSEQLTLRIREKLETQYTRANQRSHGTLGIVRSAVGRFTRVQGLEASAAIAYYAIFSIFPLLLTLVSVAGFLIGGEEAINLVMEFLFDIIPATPEWLEGTLRQIVAQRSVNGIIGLVGLLLAASGVFTTLARNVNRAWPEAKKHSLVRGQLIAFGLIAILVSVMVLWMIWSTLITLFAARDYPIIEDVLPIKSFILNPLTKFFYWLVSFLFFLLIYRWLPNTKVFWREAFWGALTAAAGWTILTIGFTWFMSTPFASYDILYGSVGTSVALLTWVFISAMIMLLGAHISAAIARITRPAHSKEALSEGASKPAAPKTP